MKHGADNYRDSSILEIIGMLSSASDQKQVIIYEPNLDVDVFLGCKVISDLKSFLSKSQVILSNRWSEELSEVADKVYTRDIFGRD